MEGDLVLESLLNNDKLAKRFLLGDVSESERAQIEDRLLADEDFFQELLIVEDDLIDAYVRDELSASERGLFEQGYPTSPSRRARIEFAKTLLASVSGKPASVVPAVITAHEREPARPVSWWHTLFGGLFIRRPAFGFTMAAVVALLVVVLGGLWVLTERTRTPSAPQEAQVSPPINAPPMPVTPRETPSPQIAEAERPPSNSGKETTELPTRETPKRTAPVVATFTLLPGALRGESGTRLVLPAGTTEARLRLGMEGEAYKKYRATLWTPEGRQVWSRGITNGSSPNSARLTLSLPANLLKNGDYVLSVSGANADGDWQSVADYSFRVVKK